MVSPTTRDTSTTMAPDVHLGRVADAVEFAAAVCDLEDGVSDEPVIVQFTVKELLEGIKRSVDEVASSVAEKPSRIEMMAMKAELTLAIGGVDSRVQDLERKDRANDVRWGKADLITGAVGALIGGGALAFVQRVVGG